MSAKLETIAVAEQRGFALTETGGGCTALEKKTAYGCVLITAENDAIVPEIVAAPVMVTWFDEYGDESRSAHCENLDVALDLVDDDDPTREGISI